MSQIFIIGEKKITNKKNISISKSLGGGVLNELSHEIDYCIFLFGFPKKVLAFNFNSKKYDHVMLMINQTFTFTIQIMLKFTLD